MNEQDDYGTAKWLNYSFGVYPYDVDWHATPGLYVFAARGEGLVGSRQWRALYVGQTHSFADRIPTHEKWQAGVRLGAAHVHARREDDEETRELIERELIQEYQPPLNELLK